MKAGWVSPTGLLIRKTQRRVFMANDQAKVVVAWNKEKHDVQEDMTKKIQTWKRRN